MRSQPHHLDQTDQTDRSTSSDPAAGVSASARRGRRGAAGLAIAATAAVGVPALASAATLSPMTTEPTPPADVPAALEARVERLCARVDNLQLRTDRLLARLEADADTRGSLAWLAAQAERAREQDRDDLAVVLENRLAVRTAALEVVELRVEALATIAEFCAGRVG